MNNASEVSLAMSSPVGYPYNTRLRIAAIGLIVFLAGVYRMTTGPFSWTNSYGLHVDAGLASAIGLAILLFAAIPNSWFMRALKRRSRR